MMFLWMRCGSFTLHMVCTFARITQTHLAADVVVFGAMMIRVWLKRGAPESSCAPQSMYGFGVVFVVFFCVANNLSKDDILGFVPDPTTFCATFCRAHSYSRVVDSLTSSRHTDRFGVTEVATFVFIFIHSIRRESCLTHIRSLHSRSRCCGSHMYLS